MLIQTLATNPLQIFCTVLLNFQVTVKRPKDPDDILPMIYMHQWAALGENLISSSDRMFMLGSQLVKSYANVGIVNDIFKSDECPIADGLRREVEEHLMLSRTTESANAVSPS